MATSELSDRYGNEYDEIVAALHAVYGNELEELAVLESQWATFRLGYAYNRRVFNGRNDIGSVQNDRMLSARVLMDIADVVEREGAGKSMNERRRIAVETFRGAIERLDTYELVEDDIQDLLQDGGMERVFENGVREFDTKLNGGHLLMSPYHSAFRCMGVYDEFDARLSALGRFMGEIEDPFFDGERLTRDFRTYAQPMFAVETYDRPSLRFILGRDIDNVAISEDTARRRSLYEYNPELVGEDGQSRHRLYDIERVSVADDDLDFVRFEDTKKDREGNEHKEDAQFTVDSVDAQGNQTKVRRSVNFALERDLMSLSDFYRLRPYMQDKITIDGHAARRVGLSGSVPTKTGLLYAHFIEPYMNDENPISVLARGDFSGTDDVSVHNARSQRILKELLLSQIKTAADMADMYASLGMNVTIRPVTATPGALELSVSDAVHNIAVRVTGALTVTEDNGRYSVYAPMIDTNAKKGAGGLYSNFAELDNVTSAEEIGKAFDQTGTTDFRNRSQYRLGYTMSNYDDVDPVYDVPRNGAVYNNRAMLPILCNTDYLRENQGCGILDESLNIYHIMLPSLGLLGVPAFQLSNVLSGEDSANLDDTKGDAERGLIRSSKLIQARKQKPTELIKTSVRQVKLPASSLVDRFGEHIFPARYVDVVTTHRKVTDAEQTVTPTRDEADDRLVRVVESARERASELVGVGRLRNAAYAAVNDMLERAHQMDVAKQLDDDESALIGTFGMGVTLTADNLDDVDNNAKIAQLYKMVEGKGMDGEPVTLPDDGHSTSVELGDLRRDLWNTLIGRVQMDEGDLGVDERVEAFIDDYVGSYRGRDNFLYPVEDDTDNFRSPSSILYKKGDLANKVAEAQDFLKSHFDDVKPDDEASRIGLWAERVMFGEVIEVKGEDGSPVTGEDGRVLHERVDRMDDLRDLFDQHSPSADFVGEDGRILKPSFNPAHVARLSFTSERALGDIMASAWLPDDVNTGLNNTELARSLAANLWQRYEFDRLSSTLLGDHRDGARVMERLRRFDPTRCISGGELRQIGQSDPALLEAVMPESEQGQVEDSKLDMSDADVRARVESALLGASRLPSDAGDVSYSNSFRESLGLDIMPDAEAVSNMRAVITSVGQTLMSLGFHNGADCKINFEVDESGILRYIITRPESNALTGVKAPFAHADNQRLVGQVGPICVPDARGVVRFPNGRYYVPPMRGHVLPRSLEHPGGVASRMGVTTYQQSLMSAVSAAVRADVLTLSDSQAKTLNVGSAYSLNRFYGLQRTDAEDVTSLVTGEHEGIMAELDDARVRALASLVMLPKSYGEGGDRADLSAMSRFIDNGRMMDDSHGDTLRMLGRPCSVPSVGDASYIDLTTWRDGPKQGEKMSLDRRIAERVLGAARDGASSSGRNINRSLLVRDVVSDLEANDVEMPNFATAPIRDFVTSHVTGYGAGEHDPMFRLMMANSNLMHCRAVLEDVGVAMMPFRGWCQDDGLVISSELAERVQLEDSVNGGTRGLRIGDKLSDCHGNKGTVACVIDITWTEQQARGYDLFDEWQVFRDNPTLDIVVNPYSPVSRGNAGSIVEMVGNFNFDIVLRDENGEPYTPGRGVGYATWLVHDKEVDQKTVIYDRENPGKHRNAGWQSNAAFIGDGVYKLLDDIYRRGGGRGFDIFREAMLMCGVVVDDKGNIHAPKEGYNAVVLGRELVKPTGVASGKNIDLTDGESLHERLVNFIKENKGAIKSDGLSPLSGSVEKGLSDDDQRINTFVDDVMSSIRKDGCAIALPFQLKLSDQIVGRLNEVLVDPLGEDACYATVDNGDGTHWLPILSQSCQYGSDDDLLGSSLYDSDYSTIIKCAIRYSLLDRAIKVIDDKLGDKLGDELVAGYGGITDSDKKLVNERAVLVNNMQYCCNSAQQSLDKIINNVYDKRLSDSKWNCINRGMVRCPYPYLSATSVWTPDPRLALDDVRIGPEMAKRLKVRDGDLLYIERSPVLQASAHVVLRARVDDGVQFSNRAYGVAINPLMCQLLSGDFDGDTVAVLSVPDMPKEVQEELRARANLETRILDFDHPESGEGGSMMYETVTSSDEKHEWRVPKVGFSLGLKGADMAYADDAFGKNVKRMRARLLRELCEAIDKNHELTDITGDMMREAIVHSYGKHNSAYSAAHRCVRDLSDECRAVLKGTTAKCAADLSDTETFVEWLDNNVVKVGAKGSEGRLAELRDYMGADMSNDEERVRRELRDAECDMAISTKSQVTGLAGTFMKNALAVAYDASGTKRADAVRLAMVQSEGMYQATLDVKCDPSAAFHLQDMLFHAVPEKLYRTSGKTAHKFAEDMLDVFQHGGMGRCITSATAHEFANLLPSPEDKRVAKPKQVQGGEYGLLDIDFSRVADEPSAPSNVVPVDVAYDAASDDEPSKVCGMRDKVNLPKGMSLFEASQTGFIDNVFAYRGSNVGGWVEGGFSDAYGRSNEFVNHVYDVKSERKSEPKRYNKRGRNRAHSDQVFHDQYDDGSFDSYDGAFDYGDDEYSGFDDTLDVDLGPGTGATTVPTTPSTGVRVYSPDDMQVDKTGDFPDL